MKSETLAILAGAAMLAVSCNSSESKLSESEKNLINSSNGLMRVLSIDNEEDSLFLRAPSAMLSIEDIASGDYALLAERMVITVTDSSQAGVGIAGPQVGLHRRVVAVQRFDKEGEPFEVYPNIRLDTLGTETILGGEGCLSVPSKRGTVRRAAKIRIWYTDPATLATVSEEVEGFTAVIFQHECDHLDGILYIDRADTVSSIGN